MEQNKFIDKFKSILRWEYLPFVIYMIVMFLTHLQYAPSDDDVALVENTLKPTVWEEFASVAYNFNQWSSRVLVNLPIHILLHFDYRVWLVIELGLLALIYKSISFIFNGDKKLENEYVLMAMLLLYPFDYATTAGWITTTMTYIWPMALGLYSFTAIKKAWDGHRFRWYEYIFYILATVYSANQEQMSVFMLVIFGTSVVLLATEKNRKLSPMIVIQGLCVVANLLFHVLVPGNTNRSGVESSVRFPDYADLSLFDKLEMGFSGTLYEFFFQHNMMFLAFSGILLVTVWYKTKNVLFRLISVVPLLAQVVFGWGCHYILELKMHIGVFENRLHTIGTINESNFFSWKAYYPIVLLFAISICLILSLYIAFGNSKESIFAVALLFSGLGGRMVLSFSPTIWASALRTYTVMYIVFIILAVMLTDKINFDKLGKLKYVLFAMLFVIMACFQYILFKIM